MKSRKKLLIILTVIVAMMSLAIYTNATTSYFLDNEQSTDDDLNIRWGLFTLNDGFEGTPWDQYWNENGTTTWIRNSSKPHNGIYNAYSVPTNKGYLTSDEIEASTVASISVSFWFKLKNLAAGECLVQTYNGTAYNTWYDLTAYPTYANNTWCSFNEVITDSQYLIAGFRLRFNTSALSGGGHEASMDDVVITTDTVPPSAPTGLSATAGGEQINLNWNDNAEGDLWGYNVYRSTTTGGPYSKISSSLVPSSDYTNTGLYGGGTYYYVVKAIDLGNNESGYSNEASATANNVAPSAPTGLAATPGDEQVSLDWADNTESDLSGYNVYRSTSGGGPYTKVNTSVVASSNYTNTGLYGGGTYYYVVKAIDLGNNESGYSNQASTTANDIAPAAPTGLSATPGNEQISLDWANNTESDLSGYNVYRSTSGGGPYTKVNTSVVASSNYTNTELYGGGIYYYVVTAVDLGSNQSGYSNEASATANNIAPAAPTNLAATPGDRQVSLNWNDNTESDLAGYNVYRSTTAGGPYSKINGSLVSTSGYLNTGLTGGTTYYYVVTAVDLGSNESGYSSEASATPTDSIPAAPTNLAATPGDKQVSLNWNDNAEGDLWGYNVYGGTSSGGPYTKINGSPLSTSDYLDTGLTGGTTYYYVVTAVDLAGQESGYSNEASATPTDLPPTVPTNLTATPGDRQVSLNWNDNTEGDLDGYNIYRSQTTGGPYTKINGSLVSVSDYLDTGLTGGVTYYYVVTAVDLISQESGYSNEASATPTDLPPTASTNLTATPGDRQVSLNWNDNSESDLNGYNVYRSQTTGGPYTKINGSLVSVSDYLDTGLTGGTTYYYVVKAVDLINQESGYSNEANATPTDNVPAPPTNLTTSPGYQQVSLNWNDNSESDLAGYNVYRNQTTGGPYTKINGSLVSTSNYVDSELTVGTTYYYVVTAVDLISQESSYSNEASGTPDPPPAAPTNLTATPGDRQVSLNWNDNSESDLAGYNVYRSTTSGGPYTKVNGSPVSTSDYLNTGLTGGTTYYYVVTAVDTLTNESGYSNEASATPTDSIPAAPTNLAATPGDRQVSLDWNDNSESDLAGYNVYRSQTSGGPYTKINGSVVVTSSYLDTSVSGGVTYYYVVKAVDQASQESGYSNEASATPTDSIPAVPTNLAATSGDRQVSLNWNDNTESDLNGYNVYRSQTSGGPYTKINGSLVSTSNYTDNSLTGGTTYYYVVTAVDLASQGSGYSNEANATPTDLPPTAPTNLAATPGDKQVSLNWNDNSESDLAGYNVYRSQTSGGPYTKINGSLVSTSDYVDTGLTGGVTYYYVVKAVDLISQESGYSNEASATPTDLPPAAPTGLTATKGVGQVSLNWNDNSESDLAGYNVYRSQTSGGPYTKINGSLVTSSSYLDTSVTNGVRYYYVVTAADLTSHESGYSNEANARPVGPPQTLLNDGFEGTPWDGNWNDNGATNWTRSTTPYSGSYSAGHASGNTYLTSDNLNTFAAENIVISFWFNIKDLNKGPLYVQIYNGTTYNNWFDLTTYPGAVKMTWIYFSQTTTDSQYFISNFRLRFDGSGETTSSYIDDVLININQ